MYKPILVVIFFILAGCVPTIHVEYFNHTNNAVHITGCGETVSIPINEASTFAAGCGISITSLNGTSWTYKNFPRISVGWIVNKKESQYLESKFPSGELVKTQLEPDGSLYILKSNTKVPAKDFSEAILVSPD